MRFVWDEKKNRLNLAKHKISFETAMLVFDDPRAVSRPDREEAAKNGGRRWASPAGSLYFSWRIRGARRMPRK
jgi:uncharacterized DUF497 family protein